LSMNDFSDGNGTPTLNVEAGVTLAITGALNLNTSTATAPGAGDPLLVPASQGVINNLGTITVGGATAFLQRSVLNNQGTLVLSDGGDFKDQSSINNAGTIEFAGSTLNVAVDIHNSYLGTSGILQIDQGAVLKFVDSTSAVGTTVSDGKVTIAG